MGRIGILITLLFYCSLNLFSQQEYDYRKIDSITYKAYLTGAYDTLISTGKKAIKSDIDYYYLRQRIGIAYFKKNNFRAASRQFEAAAQFNPENTITQNYLYYSFLYSGQFPEASYFADKLNANMREMSGIPKQGVFRSVVIETGPEFSDNFKVNEFGRLPGGQELQYQDLYGNRYYTSLGLSLQLSPRLNLNAAFKNLIIDKKTSIQYARYSPDSIVQHEWGFSKYFPEKPGIESSEYDYRLVQNSAYLRSGLYLGKGWSVAPAIHYIHFNTKKVVIQNNSRSVQDTAYYIASSDSVSYFQYELIDLQLSAQDYRDDLFVISLGINKRVSVFDLGMFGSWSNMYGRSQYQYGIKVAYFPLGNLWLYGITGVKGLTDKGDTRIIVDQMVGGRLTGFLWAEAFGAFGNLKGTNESDAFLVYNITDDINLKAGMNLIFVISPKVRLTLRYQYLQKTGFRYTYGQGNNPGEKVQDIDYTNQSIIGGIKWTF